MDVREAYEKTVHCYRLSMRMLKLATYIVLNIGVLLTALVSKGALLLMTNSVAKVQEVISIWMKEQWLELIREVSDSRRKKWILGFRDSLFTLWSDPRNSIADRIWSLYEDIYFLDTISRTLGMDVINSCMCSTYIYILR